MNGWRGKLNLMDSLKNVPNGAVLTMVIGDDSDQRSNWGELIFEEEHIVG